MNIRTIIISIMCCIVLVVAAQHTNLPRKTMNGKEYYVYKVSKGEGFYSISKKFDISEEDIIKYNPAAKSGLKRDQVLFIPVSMDDASQLAVSSSFRHTIKRGETLYAISKMYNVTIDEICELNPGARKRINAGDKLLIPQKNSSSVAKSTTPSSSQASKVTTPKEETKKSQSYVYHTISSGETLYAIAQRYETSVESIMRANPGIKPTKLAKGAVIRVPDVNADVVVAEKETPAETTTIDTPVEQPKEVEKEAVEQLVENTGGKYRTYCAKKKETFYSIAQKFDIAVDELRAVNPDIRKVKEGMNINIPNSVVDKDVTQNSDENVASNEHLESLYSRIYSKKNTDHINVAVMLPFMLNETESVKSALYTEYYQGFLLAVDSLKRQGYSVNVYAYDTQNSADVVRNLLSRQQMTKMDLIIAPDQDDAIDLVADFGEQHDINVVNSFSLKNEKVNTNARVFQTNIPGSYLYAETVACFIKTFKNKRVVFLDNADDTEADNEFITTLQSELSQRNMPYTTCSYKGILSDDNLSGTALSASIVFVPTSNKKEAIAEILPALDRFVATHDASDVSLFGYPGWIPQINKNLDKFYHLDTYIFSRFYIQPEDARMYDFSIKYAYWYNEEMRNASPRYAVLGFDTGLYFLQAIAQHGKNFANYDMTEMPQSIQTDFNFERINNWSGFINKSFYFVHLTRDMKIEKISF